MFIDNKSKYDFATTVDLMQDKVVENGWSVLHVHTLDQVLGKKGFDVLPVTVLEVCKAPLSARILGTDKHRSVSVMMPCRISIYKTSEGEVIISRMDAANMAKSLQGEGATVMVEAFEQMEKIIEPLVD
ncbi:MAG: DUF302 domain-containing protein [Bacteroidia bacterium]|jgi:uncharacterized protein (DUF302 family)|nr:DUF302 domain-containing protein [Bacteroidales bacterium]MDD3299340.1 DUF302 domain-containing protein [Bacteroidales bacterium]MDD3843299.1 DUF302 domain-containing protein [Bacteroidales bacterium]MDD4617572.1 DUF302 domain-containing protein [Bacteroidales bacterium]NCC47000.1 DUF302 domain-containing protein [Bacteroidia bacterium]